MERKLYKAAVEGDVTSLVDLLKDDPLILDRCMMWSYNETPLHIAAMLGHEKFVDEILNRKPELAGELDSHKFSPMHLAAAKGHLGVVKKLLTVNADMCYARDRYGRNPLHIAAVKSRVNVLKELIRESPDATRQKMGHGETILHLCVKHNNLEALKLLVESVGDPEFVNLKNHDGDTILHQAAADKQTETISFLTSFTIVEANSPNADGLTAYDILAQSGKPGTNVDNINNFCEARATTATAIVRAPSRSETEPMMRGASPPKANDHNIASPMQQNSWDKNLNKQYDWLERKKGALMVVASLTATMAFQVGVNPPGGFWQDTNNTTNPHNAGFAIMADNYPEGYMRFLAVNTLSFLASLSIILLLVSGLPLRHRFFMWILMVIMWIAIIFIAVTYAVSMMAFTPNNRWNSFFDNIAYGIFGWIGVMVLLLLGLGHMIRLMLMAIRNVRKLVTRRRSSASAVMRPDGV